ncbi:MAG: hypothetical protein DMG24_05160 [Acidobacteria bacterium]|nr:MAG: hypothetical protein DMG24_05160 [Acidobacteriota bacterium]
MSGVARRLWQGWKRVAKKIGDLQARVLLGVFYFVLVWPFALAVKWVSDPLAIRPGTQRGWRAKVSGAGEGLERARRQF